MFDITHFILASYVIILWSCYHRRHAYRSNICLSRNRTNLSL